MQGIQGWLWTGLIALAFYPGSELQARGFCFAQAISYYEQLYCEVKGSGAGAKLPTFNDFKKNNALTQALLLKRPAQQAGIRMVMPRPSQMSSSKPKPVRRASNKMTVKKQGDRLVGCEFLGQQIKCGNRVYRLRGNQKNSRLVKGALGAGNRLVLPEFKGQAGGAQTEALYLTESYRVYIEKMLSIGLAGVTLSYGKFVHIYQDLRERGVSFSERFATMFEFLKKDKRAMGASEALQVEAGLQLADCQQLSPMLIMCTGNKANHIYVGVK